MSRVSTFFFFMALMSTASAQTRISGKVLDHRQEPIPGVNVYLEGTYDGADTDAEGVFSFHTTETGEQQLVATFLGYDPVVQLIQIGATDLELQLTLLESASELSEVVITAGAFEAGDQKKGAVLKSLDIATTAGSSADIVGALQTLPGAQRIGEDGRLFVRGGDASEVRTYIDGLLVRQPYGSQAPDLPARGRFSPFQFKGMTFSTGAYSAQYGQALSSVLALETPDEIAQSSTSLSLMSVGLSGSIARKGEQQGWSAELGYSDLTPYIHLVPQRQDWQRAPHTLNGMFNYRQKGKEGGVFKAFASASSTGMKMNLSDNNQFQLLENQYDANISQLQLLNGKWSLQSGLAANHQHKSIQQGADISLLQTTLHARSTLKGVLSENAILRTGAELLWEEHKAGINELRGTWSDKQIAAFAEMDYYLSRQWVARTGLRAEYSSLAGQGGASIRQTVAYLPNKHSQWSAGFGNFQQTPVYQYYYSGALPGLEKAVHALAAYQYDRDLRTLRAELYYKQYLNLVSYPLNRPDLAANGGKGYARGFDLFYRDRKTFRYSDMWISYSYLDARRNYLDYGDWFTPGFAAKHSASLVYKRWIPGITTQIGTTYSFSSGRYFTDPNLPGLQNSRAPDFHDWSLNFSRLSSIWGHGIIIHGIINNVLGLKQNFGERFDPVPGPDGRYTARTLQPPAKRFFFLGIFINFNDDDIEGS